jgi:hypothetical protein
MDPNVVAPLHPILLKTTQSYRRKSGKKAYNKVIIFHSTYIHDERLTAKLTGRVAVDYLSRRKPFEICIPRSGPAPC